MKNIISHKIYNKFAFIVPIFENLCFLKNLIFLQQSPNFQRFQHTMFSQLGSKANFQKFGDQKFSNSESSGADILPGQLAGKNKKKVCFD